MTGHVSTHHPSLTSQLTSECGGPTCAISRTMCRCPLFNRYGCAAHIRSRNTYDYIRAGPEWESPSEYHARNLAPLNIELIMTKAAFANSRYGLLHYETCCTGLLEKGHDYMSDSFANLSEHVSYVRWESPHKRTQRVGKYACMRQAPSCMKRLS